MSSSQGVAVPAAGRRAGLLANRNFTLLWVGDALSEVGSQATSVAMPLLVLALTGSPADAGLVGLARSLAYPLAPLPAGVLVDRWDRRRVMIGCAIGRAIAMGSLVVMLAVARPPLWQLMVVAFVNAALWSVALIAERGLLAAVVAPAAISDAVAINEARASVAVIGGPPLGGALFGIARGLPFLADAISFFATGLAVVAVRVPAGAASPCTQSGRMIDGIREGITWLWHRPFLRAGSILYAAANVTLASVELLAVLIARRHGASSAAVGLAFAVIGAGGLASALVARPGRRRLSARWSVLCEPWFAAALVPMLLLAHSALLIGIVVALMFMPMALSSSVVVGTRIALTPDHLRGRVQASASFIAGSIGWIGPLAVGQLFQHAGEATTVLVLAGWTLTIAVGATLSPGLRQLPRSVSASLPLGA
ncbi:MAG: MFS transporter [Solirubrobacteraceae bacterium]